MIGGIVQMATVLERTLIQCSTLMGKCFDHFVDAARGLETRLGGLESPAHIDQVNSLGCSGPAQASLQPVESSPVRVTLINLPNTTGELLESLDAAFERCGSRHLAGILLLVLSACGTAPPVPTPAALPRVPPAVETWIISGQSNAVGCARGDSFNGAHVADVEMWTGTGFRPAQEPLAFMEPYEGCQVGPWLSAAHAVARPVRLTGWAKVGESIHNWAAGAEGWQHLEHAISTSGQGARWFLWFQGEADAVGKCTKAAYAADLEDLIMRVRRAARNPAMNVLIVGLADAPSRQIAAQYGEIRTAQQEVAARDRHAFYVSAEGLPTAVDQPYHLTHEGYRVLAMRIAAMVR